MQVRATTDGVVAMAGRKRANVSAGERGTKVSVDTENSALYIAMAIRNAMEAFHIAHLTDEQMKALNPIIRNAVCTALHAVRNYDRSSAAREFVDFTTRTIPRYWERPVLLDDYLQCEALHARKAHS